MSDGIVVISPQGRLDSATGPAFESQVKEAVAGGASGLIVDCGKLDYISSAGLRVVLLASKQMKARGSRLVLCSLLDEVAAIFEISGLGGIVDIVKSPDEARRRLAANPAGQ